MAITVTMPQLGESVTEGTIGAWLVQPGQAVERFESLVEVITDKVTAEVPAPAAGTVGEILAAEGQRLSVGAPLCTLETAAADGSAAIGAAEPIAAEPSGDEPSADEVGPAEVEPSISEEPQSEALPPAAENQGTAGVSVAPEAPPAPPGLPEEPNGAPGFISPAVRALAEEQAVDITQVTGTGFQGRITKRDVLMHLESRGTAPATSPRQPPAPRVPAPAPALPGARIPHTPMRRAIAEHMLRSRQTSPHAWTMVEVDMSGVASARAARRAEFHASTGIDLSFLHFGMKSTCLALRAVPTMNAVFEEDAIQLRKEVNLGLAVAVGDGLIVPVVRGADQFSVAGLAQAAANLIERARQGKARQEDLEGGTFTLNNAGALGTVMSQAIINQPQAGILVMDSVVRRPVVEGDGIAIRPIMNLSLSFDHRINDGASAAHFLRAVKSSLEAVTPDSALF
ncbi:MAG TPA: dihydrolipoamide acetyltransferase family protein [Candidatus Micrarchaeaceae archaeon]|nr:dihydrolipoamide acetyltransferase family protein [Candidatus Micrarchaeaceae archaeon]